MHLQSWRDTLLRRRSFLIGLVAVIAGALGWLWSWLRPSQSSVNKPTLPDSTLPAQFSKNIEILCERLLPAGDNFPGASQLGVLEYLQNELRHDELQGARRVLLRGAAQVDVVARSVVGKAFSQSTVEEQEEVIAAMLAGQGQKASFDPAAFIRLLLLFTIEGSFGDPIHGGNKEERGWQWVGYAMHSPRPNACLEGNCP